MVKLAAPTRTGEPGRVQPPARGHPGRAQVAQGHGHGLQAPDPLGPERWSGCLCQPGSHLLWSTRPFPPAQSSSFGALCEPASLLIYLLVKEITIAVITGRCAPRQERG